MLNIIKAGASKAVPIGIAVLSCVAMNVYAQGHTAALALRYDSQTLGPVPVPPSERGLQTVVAEPWFKVSDKRMILEGPAFDRDGSLLFCDVSESRVLRLTPDKRLSVVVSEKQVSPGGIAIHEDGRIFIAALNLVERTGDIIAVKPDGTDRQTIVRLDAGYMPNDLVVDRNGGLYFSDFRGPLRTLRAVSITFRRMGKPPPSCCLTSQWRTASH